MAASITKHEAIVFSYPLALASCTRIVGMGMAMECTHLRKYTSQYVHVCMRTIITDKESEVYII